VSCLPNSGQLNNDFSVKSRLLLFPTASYDSIILINGRLIAFAEDPNKPRSESISFAYEGDANLTPFNPQIDKECQNYTIYYINDLLPDGHLGLLKECRKQSGAVRSIYAYDWGKATLSQLVPGELPQGPSPKNFTWNSEMTKGVQEMGNGLEGTIYWISPEGVSPMDIEIENQGLKWNLKDYLEGKDRVGSATDPAWSPDGKTIAFFASAYGIREEPLPKMNVKHGLYLMDVSTLMPVQVLPNFVDAFQLRWSPDSKQLLFNGCMGFQLKCGLWLYNLGRKSLNLVDVGHFQNFTWITNNKIVAAKDIEEISFKDNQIIEYVISEP
jgi:hypothetical protein